ncbi:hypothetical protein [Raineya orbicola]|jgi:hypothetical protein|uniref:Tetratricopeptide repeat n=1 Tax=Raineya orbicola TaxID=2016530 RepID=A0A2N3II13_9BACT|nr:hypothetical protein [Raineya orbicola]PKQ70000.1 hypothetical protein Rain11_0937 [Raineya orbicola]
MRKLCLLFLLACANLLLAQDFKVLHSYGNNTLKTTKKKIFIGTSLKNSDVIVVGENSYINLMHEKTGKTLEIKQKGEYLLGNFKVPAQGSSTFAKYGSFVLGEMTKAEKQDINKNHRKYMAMTGAVSRERKSISIDKAIPLVVPPESENSYLFGNSTTIVWVGEEGKKYYVRIKTLGGETVALLEVTQPKFTFNFSLLKKNKDGLANYEVLVYEAENENVKGSFNISLLEARNRSNIEKEIKDFRPETAMDYLILARFFEENKLLFDALSCYEKALEMQNDEFIKTTYMEFLVRNRMGYTYAENQEKK